MEKKMKVVSSILLSLLTGTIVALSFAFKIKNDKMFDYQCAMLEYHLKIESLEDDDCSDYTISFDKKNKSARVYYIDNNLIKTVDYKLNNDAWTIVVE